MILVVCPNLAVDVTLEVRGLELGGVHRTRGATRRAGGKGVNVARALRALGETALVVGFAGGRRGEELRSGLALEEIWNELVSIEGESRSCTIVLEEGGRATVVNEAGPRVTEKESDTLVERVEALLTRARAVALMGSLTPGSPPDLFASLVSRARELDLFCLVDTSGDALRESLSRRPSLVKPNQREAEQVLDRELGSGDERLRALEALRARGADVAVVTLGAEGLVLSDGALTGRFWMPASADLRLGNPTGAGDALAAGLVTGVARGYPLEETARLGVAAATASLAEGYGRIRAKDLRTEAVRFEPLSAG